MLGTGKYPDVLKMIAPETRLDLGQGLLNGPLSKHFIPVSATRGFAGLEILVPRRRLLLMGNQTGFC